MNIPGFNADRSLNRSSRSYSTRLVSDVGASDHVTVVPQWCKRICWTDPETGVRECEWWCSHWSIS